MPPMLSLPLLLALPGCPEGGESAPEETAAVVDSEAPVVESATVTCFQHTTGEAFVQWTGNATASDPQGLSTIETFGTLAVRDARGDLGEASLVCADGACTTSWRDHEFDIECDTIAVSTYDFAFRVVDHDGHESAELVVAGEKVEE